VATFVGGACFRIAYRVGPCGLMTAGSYSVDPGPGPDMMALAKANREVDAFLTHSVQRSAMFDPKVIVAPDLNGYTIYFSSGSATRSFPDALLESSKKVIRESLDQSTRRTSQRTE